MIINSVWRFCLHEEQRQYVIMCCQINNSDILLELFKYYLDIYSRFEANFDMGQYACSDKYKCLKKSLKMNIKCENLKKGVF